MSIFKRIGDIIKSNKEEPVIQKANPFEDTQTGDIVTVDLEEYVVTGKVIYFDRGYAPHRWAYYLQNGKQISCLLVEKGRTYECFHCQFLEGALDDPGNVPTRLEVDGSAAFELEWNRTDVSRTEGNTDFRSGDDVMIWRYFSSGDHYFFLQWQDGKFVAMQGERLTPGLIKFMSAGASPNRSGGGSR